MRLMIRFHLFGVPVSIHPSLWLTLALVGGLLSATSASAMLGVALFVIAGFFCLLVHEMGHALMGRRLGGGNPQVFMAWLGGDCCNEKAVLTRLQGVAMTAAGPASSLLLGLLALALLSTYVGGIDAGMELAANNIFGIIPPEYAEHLSPAGLEFFRSLIQVSFWWTLLNLIPVFPLDGGQIMHGLMRSSRTMHMVSLIVALLLVMLFILFNFFLMAVFMCFLAYINYQGMQQAPY